MEAALNVAHQGMDAAKQLATGTAEAVSKLTTDPTVQAADVSGAIRQSATYKKDEEGKETLDFAVWAEPSEDVLITLDCIVNELALDTDAPAFKPHVTLWRATMPIDTDPDVLIAEVENAIKEWKATIKGDAVLKCTFAGVEERRGALVALLNPTPQLEELHNWIHTSIDGLVGLEPHPFEPHVKLLDEGTLPVGETPEKHLATLAKNGRLLDIDSACLQVDGFEAHKLTFTQAAKEDEPSLWFALREFAI